MMPTPRLSLKLPQKAAPGFHNTFCTSFHCHKGKGHCVKFVFRKSFFRTEISTKHETIPISDFRKLCLELEYVHLNFLS